MLKGAAGFRTFAIGIAIPIAIGIRIEYLRQYLPLLPHLYPHLLLKKAFRDIDARLVKHSHFAHGLRRARRALLE